VSRAEIAPFAATPEVELVSRAEIAPFAAAASRVELW
jgi:hypothetical protein